MTQPYQHEIVHLETEPLPPNQRVVFAIDYDRTYTRDPFLFNHLIAAMRARGHRVFIVTSRCGNGYDSVCLENQKELAEETKDARCTVVFTDGAAKDWHMKRKLGVKVDIWIDDDQVSITKPR